MAGRFARAAVMSALVRYSFDGWDDAKIMEEVGHFRNDRLDTSQHKFLLAWEQSNQAGAYREKIGLRPISSGK